jgi:hypothetical protein
VRAYRTVSVVLIAFLVTGCSSTRQVPREEFEAVSHEPLRVHHVTMTDGSDYSVTRFSVTDSTFVIEELGKTDERYAYAVMPIVRRLDSVAALETKDARGEAWVVLVVVGLVFIAVTAGSDWFSGLE